MAGKWKKLIWVCFVKEFVAMWSKMLGFDLRLFPLISLILTLGTPTAYLLTKKPVWLITFIVWIVVSILITSYKFWRRDLGLREHKQVQEGHEEKWLRLVVEEICPILTEKRVLVRFDIDSGLVYDLPLSKVWIWLVIGEKKADKAWEFESVRSQTLLKGQRSKFPPASIPIQGHELEQTIICATREKTSYGSLIVEIEQPSGHFIRLKESKPYPCTITY